MTLDNHELSRLVSLYRTVAQANSEIAALYAGKLEQKPVGKNVVARASREAIKESTQPEVRTHVQVSVESTPAKDPNKPQAQRVAVAGIDMSKMGLTQSGGSSIAWDVLVGHPPFHMFMSESQFSNPEGKDAMDLAVDFITEQSKTKAELVFFAEYAKWFKDKGFWPGETPFGQPLQALKG